MTRYGREITRSPAVEEAYWLGAGDARSGLDEFMALIADGQQAIVDLRRPRRHPARRRPGDRGDQRTGRAQHPGSTSNVLRLGDEARSGQ